MLVSGTGGVTALAVALLLVVVALLSPPGRRAAHAVFSSVGRWPGLIRSELRGDAPLEAGEQADRRDDTTPDIPAVRAEPPATRTFPQVGRPE
ncbi:MULTISPECIES: hypothetical protein [unclassified Pseudonocardia]|uniref:hypothetical protein n=1 Tax=unclassified Pseudonocardia TaxID=2619320 RepID=UPI000963105B|nr:MULTISPECIES: hypothetical protein [unclassified Pseudonocardia]OLL84206.1 hypothetical protein Ae263Ps1_1261c [Pseudonocardia sp. Ae263_Ps1]OLL95776.1 hypothetical protein Ae356Ps1_5673 [Pseudonocardia sp. Ae356_Ps1]